MKAIYTQLMADEGKKLHPYKCTAGKWTIGFGRNIEDNGISEEEAFFMLQNDVAKCEETLIRHYDYFPYLNEARKNVMINMLFNLGFSRFLGFARFLKAVAEKNFEKAADEILDSLAARQLPERYGRLAKAMRDGI